MNVDVSNVIMAEKVSSRGHLFSTPEKGDHLPSVHNMHWRKASQRGQTELMPEEQRRQCCDQCEKTIKHCLR